MLISPHMLAFKHGCLGTVCSFWHFYVDQYVDFVSLCIINGWKGGCVDGWAWVWDLLILGLVGHGHRGGLGGLGWLGLLPCLRGGLPCPG